VPSGESFCLEATRAGGARATQASLFSEGDSVRIIEGPFSDFTGKIMSLNEATGVAKVEVEIFGRSTPAEVKLRQLRRD